MLEVGCGTGKATVGFATLDLTIVALDPGPAMIAEARTNVGDRPGIRFVHSTFEDWSPDAGPFDLIAAAQAWHWVPPSVGYLKAADLLVPGGVLAILGNDWHPRVDGFRNAIDEVYLRLAPELRDSPMGVWYRPEGPLPQLMDGSGLFAERGYRRFDWSRRMTLESYLAMLVTLSNHQGLEPDRLRSLVQGLEAAARPFGDTVDIDYTTHLHYSRRL